MVIGSKSLGGRVDKARGKETTFEWQFKIGSHKMQLPRRGWRAWVIKPFPGKPTNPIMTADDPLIPASVKKMILQR